MKRISALSAALALLFTALSLPALAAPHISDFTLGISRDEARLRAAGPCAAVSAVPNPAGQGEKMCGEVSFGGMTWPAALTFAHGAGSGEGLSAITLSGPPDLGYLEAAFQGFAESPYVLYTVLSSGRCFDFLQKSRDGKGPDAISAEFSAFLTELRANGDSFASYFYTDPALFAAAKGRSPAPCGGPQPVDGMPEGVAGSLTVANDGVTVVITQWADWQRDLAARAPRAVDRNVAPDVAEGAESRAASEPEPNPAPASAPASTPASTPASEDATSESGPESAASPEDPFAAAGGK